MCAIVYNYVIGACRSGIQENINLMKLAVKKLLL